MRVDSLHAVTLARLAVVGIDAPLRSAALSLARPGIGLVIVCSESGAASGVLSKSDLVRHLSDAGSVDAPVAQLMTRPIVSCEPNDDVDGVWRLMTARSLQNVPVLGARSEPLGILDIRDAMKALLEQEQFEEHLLTNYIAGIGYQ